MYYLHYSSFFQTTLKKEKKVKLSRIVCVIQNHNLETEKTKKPFLILA